MYLGSSFSLCPFPIRVKLSGVSSFLEDRVLPFGGDTAAGVRNPEIELSGTEFVAEADRSPVREFRGVRHPDGRGDAAL